MDTIESLTAEYQKWCEDHGVTEPLSADELLVSPNWELDFEEREWLRLFVERWGFAQEFENARFSEVLDAYLKHRASEPDEVSGYTDKVWCRHGARLEDRLNSFFNQEQR